MPFPISWLEAKIAASAREDRLAHAYLLTGGTVAEQESAFYRLASVLLGDADPVHPDLHIVRPESKSRRITIDQIRSMERELRLKSFHQGRKIAGILSADRMCLGQAEAANAFLKTLEEPPEHCVIFLATDRPEQLLRTIQSRCLTLALENSASTAPPLLPPDWLQAWFQPGADPAFTAYQRARLLQDLFQILREQAEARLPGGKPSSDEEKEALAAVLESEFILSRNQALAELTQASWQRAQAQGQRLSATNACLTLDDLRVSLGRNVDAALAIDRCCLKLSGLL